MKGVFHSVGGLLHASRLEEGREEHAGEQIPHTVAMGIAALIAIILSLSVLLMG